jgi:hypothetical protein
MFRLMLRAPRVKSSTESAHSSRIHAIALRARAETAIAASREAMNSAFDALAYTRVVCARAGVLISARRPRSLVVAKASGASSGRIILRHHARHPRLAASTESTNATPPQLWAHAEVFGMRLIDAPIKNVFERLAGASDMALSTWTVRELDAGAIPGALKLRCLVFENHESVRRIWDYPHTWLTMPALDLLKLAGL